jgi:hypothetical protein
MMITSRTVLGDLTPRTLNGHLDGFLSLFFFFWIRGFLLLKLILGLRKKKVY